ncbi:MAG: sugar ABC transporter ATP-binding protein, partial [Clostridiales bacterium]|nr:sugar ABC transporter ATP-binding protein [Clostridiales bacterium]
MENVVELRNIRKSFSGNEVLHGVDFHLRRGEVHAIVGENGAGKSTLMNILMGSLPVDSGELQINGEVQKTYGVGVALAKGITIIPQELALVPAISVGENIMLNQRPRGRARLVDWNRLHKTAAGHLRDMGFPIDPYQRLDSLPIAYRQIVAIVKAVSENKQVVIMDEPTSSLSREEVLRLHEIIRSLKAKGTTVIYISHLLEEIFAISDRITILRDGNVVGTKDTVATYEQEVVTLMVGESLYKVHDELLHRHQREALPTDREVVLSVRDLKRNERTPGISFDLHEGEILGITGLVGSGKTELARCIFGQDRFLSGEIRVRGRATRIASPEKAI